MGELVIVEKLHDTSHVVIHGLGHSRIQSSSSLELARDSVQVFVSGFHWSVNGVVRQEHKKGTGLALFHEFDCRRGQIIREVGHRITFMDNTSIVEECLFMRRIVKWPVTT